MGFFEDRGELGPPPEPFRFRPTAAGGSASFKWLGLAALVLVTYFAASVLKSIYVDVLWFSSVGYERVYQTELVARIGLFIAGTPIQAPSRDADHGAATPASHQAPTCR